MTAGSHRIHWLRIALVVALYAGCVAVLYLTEYAAFGKTLSLATLVFVCCLGIVLFGRPGIAAALALIAFNVLIALSHLKYDVTQLTLTFLDLLLIDPDTFSFLVTTHPWLKWQIALGVTVALLSVAGGLARSGRRLGKGGRRDAGQHRARQQQRRHARTQS